MIRKGLCLKLFRATRNLEKCEELDLFVLFCLQTSFPFMEQSVYGSDSGANPNGSERWENNSYKIEIPLDPYNEVNVKEFFTNTNAKRFFSNKVGQQEEIALHDKCVGT